MTQIAEEKKEKMNKIETEIVGLKKSPLYRFRVKNKNMPVVGEGSLSAKIMFVGEAPGKNEAKTGKPFCGASGKILDELLKSIKIEREKVYITSIVKDRPPENRDPTPKEVRIYGPFLDKQIEIIKPKVIATLGRYAMDYIIKKFGLIEELKVISKMHGKVFDAKVSYGKIKILTLYHPAVSVYNSHTKSILKKDFQILKNL